MRTVLRSPQRSAECASNIPIREWSRSPCNESRQSMSEMPEMVRFQLHYPGRPLCPITINCFYGGRCWEWHNFLTVICVGTHPSP
jgi:hypothetical protein